MKPDDPCYPTPSSEAVSAAMRGNRKTDSKPERLLGSELHSRGLRYRKNAAVRTSIGMVRSDIAFSRRKVVVFVDGCFWHSCPQHGTQPSVNAGYWQPKLAGNRARDRLVTDALTAEGWLVVRVWEHQSILEAADTVERALSIADPDR
jgi:DNA mismatch endonuclease, patch repair protein